ncbi:MAG: Bro-N domain-containing protein [Methanocella sp.]
MNEIVTRVFEYEGNRVRTALRNGEPRFHAGDVCAILEIGNPSQALARLDEDEKDTLISNDTVGRPQEMLFVTEAGLYALVLGSRKPEAKLFKRWITHEVIPAIRQNGGYLAKPMSVEDMIILQAQSVKELKAKVDGLEQKIEWQERQIEDTRQGMVDINVPLRNQFNKAVRELAFRRSLGYDAAYDTVYDTLGAQEHIDIKRRARNRGVKPIDILEQSDLLVKATRLAKAL